MPWVTLTAWLHFEDINWSNLVGASFSRPQWEGAVRMVFLSCCTVAHVYFEGQSFSTKNGCNLLLLLGKPWKARKAPTHRWFHPIDLDIRWRWQDGRMAQCLQVWPCKNWGKFNLCMLYLMIFVEVIPTWPKFPSWWVVAIISQAHDIAWYETWYTGWLEFGWV